MRIILLFSLFLLHVSLPVAADQPFEKDIIETSAGDLEITFIGHGTLMFVLDETVIHIDPFSRLVDYDELPDADMVVITHHHFDHLDVDALQKVRTDKTVVILTATCAEKVEEGVVMKNGDTQTFYDIEIEAVPAYNLIHKRSNGQVYHPKGQGNGYVLTVGETRIYIAGDTENTPEMKALENIDYAFLPMNLPYTMTPEMVADAIMAFKPRVLYPYHFGDTDTSKLLALLEDADYTEIRMRKMK